MDIFLSYSHRDLDYARKLVNALETQGWAVFWDPQLRSGQRWPEVLDEKLEQAKCVLVLWSEASVTSEFVLYEAAAGMRRNVLLPIQIEPVQLPPGFENIQALCFTEWDRRTTSPLFKKLHDDLSFYLGSPPSEKKISNFKKFESTDVTEFRLVVTSGGQVCARLPNGLVIDGGVQHHSKDTFLQPVHALEDWIGMPRKKVEQLGRSLTREFLQRDIAEALAAVLDETSQRGPNPLRLTIAFEDVERELLTIPWEVMAVPSFDRGGNYLRDSLLCEDSRAVLQRQILSNRQEEHVQQPVEPPLRVLVVTPSKNEDAVLELLALREQLHYELAIHIVEGGDFEEAQNAMMSFLPHVLHCIGPVKQNIEYLLDRDEKPRLFICHSWGDSPSASYQSLVELGARAHLLGIPAVLVLQRPVERQEFGVFMRAFYESVTEGLPIDMAAHKAKSSLKYRFVFSDNIPAAAPVVFTRKVGCPVLVK